VPRGDRTGPMGMGAMTGRSAGYCTGFGRAGYANPVPGRNWGMGFGRGREAAGRGFGGGGHGWRHWFYATGLPRWMRFGGRAAPYPKLEPDAEKEALKSEATALQSELDSVKKRLEELESKTAAQ